MADLLWVGCLLVGGGTIVGFVSIAPTPLSRFFIKEQNFLLGRIFGLHGMAMTLSVPELFLAHAASSKFL